MKPTVIRSNELPDEGKKPVRPTVIPTAIPHESTSAPKPTVIRPTTGTSSEPLAISKPLEQKKVLAVSNPTAIRGEKRKRISVNIGDVLAENQGTSMIVIEKAFKIVETMSLDDLTDHTVLFWGQELQQKYGDLVTECLSLSQSAVLTKVASYVGRMMEILGSIDLKKVCGFEEQEGVLSRMFRRSSKIESLEGLSDAQAELAQLLKLMNESLTALLLLKERIEKASNNIEELGQDIEATIAAAVFLAAYIRRADSTKVAIADRFTDRAIGLTQTLAQIRSSSSIRQIQIEQPLRLITTVQQVALVMVPGWIGSVASLKTMLEGKRNPTVTQVGELSNQVRDILEKLKGV